MDDNRPVLSQRQYACLSDMREAAHLCDGSACVPWDIAVELVLYHFNCAPERVLRDLHRLGFLTVRERERTCVVERLPHRSEARSGEPPEFLRKDALGDAVAAWKDGRDVGACLRLAAKPDLKRPRDANPSLIPDDPNDQDAPEIVYRTFLANHGWIETRQGGPLTSQQNIGLLCWQFPEQLCSNSVRTWLKANGYLLFDHADKRWGLTEAGWRIARETQATLTEDAL